MGSIVQGIFGGKRASNTQQATSNSQSDSYNLAYPGLQSSLNPQIGQGSGATSALSALLGLGGDTAGQNSAFDNFRNNTGYQFQFDQGQKAIDNNAATSGILNSGATAKALTNYGQQTANGSIGNYLSQLLGLSNVGNTSAGILSDAGKVSTGTSSSQSTGSGSSSEKPGIGKFLGSVAAGAAASDRRLKKDIEKLYTLDSGLNVYRFTYINDQGPYIGVMADEVKSLAPEALGPSVDGFMTVDYTKIPELGAMMYG